jgi:uridine phosphorylase
MNQSIGASELIITEKGSVYHLDLRPEEIADTIITVGDPNRVKEISKHFDSIECKANHREFVTHTGYIGKKRISVVATGIGPDNIDIVLNELDALVNIDFESRTIKSAKKSLQIIRLGTSGSLQANIPVDSLVVSSFAIGLDNLMHYYAATNKEEEQQLLEAFNQHTQLVDKAIQPYIASSATSLSKHFTSGFHHGITVTCPGFYGPQGRVLRAPLAQPQLINQLSTFKHEQHFISNFEMETSAIYGLANLLGHQALSISAIVANRIHQNFSTDGNAAVEKMITTCLPIIANL